jgi:predicted SnoaL-like aldol condensation-catalyzing enzyme
MCLALAPISTVTISQTKQVKNMSNKELVKTAMTALFVNRDPSATDKYFGEVYIQHNPHIANGHEGLKKIMAGLGPDFSYEPGLVIEDGEFVMIHGRYVGWGENPMLAMDVFRVDNGKLVEHWDVMQDEVPAEKTASGNAMFPIE